MLGRRLAIKVGLSPKLLVQNMAVVATAFVWYFLAYSLIDDAASIVTSYEKLLVVGAGAAGIAIFAVIGSLLANKFWERNIFLVSWMLGGVFISLIPYYLPLSSIGELISVSTIFGSYFGLGMPTTMAFFASSTSPENRGKTAGITFLAIGMSIFILGIVGVGNVLTASISLAAIRLSGLVLFCLLRSHEEPRLNLSKSTYKEILRNRSFALYFIPWIMFNVVDYLTIPVNTPPIDVHLASALENGLIAVCAIVAGFLIDVKGRKRLSIFGFSFLGIGYASLSLVPGIGGWFFYTISDGIAWGIFNVIFLFTLWGDISHGKDSEKMYVMGALPYLFSNFVYLLAEPVIISVAPVQVFTFASFFLFLAILPLVVAPETLSEKVMKDLELKTYLERAKEIAAKAQERETDEKDGEQDSLVELKAAQEEGEEAEELAQKYY